MADQLSNRVDVLARRDLSEAVMYRAFLAERGWADLERIVANLAIAAQQTCNAGRRYCVAHRGRKTIVSRRAYDVETRCFEYVDQISDVLVRLIPYDVARTIRRNYRLEADGLEKAERDWEIEMGQPYPIPSLDDLSALCDKTVDTVHRLWEHPVMAVLYARAEDSRKLEGKAQRAVNGPDLLRRYASTLTG